MSLARANTVGLPSNPRTRSSTPGLARQNIPSRPPSSASERPPPSSYYSSAAPPLPLQPRTIRTQRSIGSISTRPAGSLRSHSLDRSSESRHALRSESPPPLPSLPRGPRIVAAQPRGRTPAPVRVHTSSIDRPEDYGGSRRRQDVLSDSGSSSAGSDGFDGPPESASSSRTSMNEMEVDDKADKKPPAGFGSSLWGNITGVASNLTVSVSKAWSSNVASYSGEETPVGGESRLTRAMKAYHTEKAHDPRDLPDWLFDERERGVRSTRTTSSSASEKKPAQETRPAELPRSVATDMDDDASPPPRITRGPTLADRKASSVSSSASNISVARAGSKEHVTKSMARLRELRDAKRGAKVRFDDAEAEAEEIREPPLRSDPVARPAPPSEPQLQPRLFRDRERMPPPTRPRGNMPAPLGASLGVRGRQPVGLPSGVRPVRS